jgi:quercetin dioxygenase-like cupin family protein
MLVQIEDIPRPEWGPLPHPDCRGVEAKVLLKREGLAIAMLRFGPRSTIHEHAASHLVEVVCLEGNGWTSVGEEKALIHAGKKVRWPANQNHRLWTEDSTMVALMIEFSISC